MTSQYDRATEPSWPQPMPDSASQRQTSIPQSREPRASVVETRPLSLRPTLFHVLNDSTPIRVRTQYYLAFKGRVSTNMVKTVCNFFEI